MNTLPFDRFGVMLDCSRNAVRSLPTLKKMVDLLQAMGYNTLMLYMEDTFEVMHQPYFGYLRGRYSIAELQEIDQYARERGMEVVPCIQTLAHINAITRWDCYYQMIDCEDILLIDDERTYRLIDDMMASLAEAFSGRLINVGMDEAYLFGLGKYREEHGDPGSVCPVLPPCTAGGGDCPQIRLLPDDVERYVLPLHSGNLYRTYGHPRACPRGGAGEYVAGVLGLLFLRPGAVPPYDCITPGIRPAAVVCGRGLDMERRGAG